MRKATVRRFIPPQHGAWAMLLLPWLAGVLVVGFVWVHVPLLVAWLTGYLASYYALLAVKTRRPARARVQLWVYLTPTVLAGGLVLALRPEVLWYAPAYALLLAVNAGYAAQRDDRALLNNFVSVLQSCLMVLVCATVAGAPLRDVVVAFAVVTAYLVGTVLHVKALIRERRNVRFRWASIGYHVVVLVGAFWVGVWVAAVFAALALRAFILSGRQLRPAVIGIVEIVASAAVLAVAVWH